MPPRGRRGGRPRWIHGADPRDDRVRAAGKPVGGGDRDQHGEPPGRGASGSDDLLPRSGDLPVLDDVSHPSGVSRVGAGRPPRGPRAERDRRAGSRESRRPDRPRPHARAPGSAPARRRRGGARMSALGHAHPPLALVRAIVRRALDEDVAWGDVTTDNSVPADQRSRAALLAKQDGVLCGVRVFAETLVQVDPAVAIDFLLDDGADIGPGKVVARIEGPTRALLTGERTALNFVQRLSGIATMTAAFTARLRGLPTRLIDTRKTTPGLRVLEKYAVRVGGGHNHRFNLADAVLLKDNHLAALEHRGLGLADAVRGIKQRVPHTMKVEVEVTSLEQIDAALAGGADVILLDTMSNDAMREAVHRIGGRALTECSGNVTLETVRERAMTGVDLISSGALTHSAKALDLSLEIEAD